MIGYAIRKGTTAGLEALGMDKDAATAIGWCLGIGATIATLDVASVAIEGAAAASVDVATHAAHLHAEIAASAQST